MREWSCVRRRGGHLPAALAVPGLVAVVAMKPGITVRGGRPASEDSARCFVHWSRTRTASDTMPRRALSWRGVLTDRNDSALQPSRTATAAA